ncbi:MAG: MOSC N-terminal beta barrel domain-containing protein [Paracoccaceae bacterium]
MTGTLAQIWRHPIKAHGFEALLQSDVVAGQTLPWDRTWAVTHEASKDTSGAWVSCSNFTRGAKAPALMAVGALLDEDSATLILSAPDSPDLTFRPDDPESVANFLSWVQPMVPPERAASTGLIRATGQGMTDAGDPYISVGNLNSLKALSDKVGTPLDPRRFRINFWVDGFEPWSEFDWLGRTLQIGDLTFEAKDRITRCKSTMANPDTGLRDADTLGALDQGWGHTDFGITLLAKTTGTVKVGNTVELS